MNVTLLALLFFSSSEPGIFHTTHPGQLTEVPEGGNVILQCRTDPPINLEKYTLDLKRADGNSSDHKRVVYSRRHGKDYPIPQMEQFRNRVFPIHEDLRKGFLTVLIRSVQQSDSGQYKCYIPKLRASSVCAIVVKDIQNWTKEHDFSTMATSLEEMADADAATKKHRHHVITITIICTGFAVVFLVACRKKICKRCKGNNELKTLSTYVKEGDEGGRLKKPSAIGVGRLSG